MSPQMLILSFSLILGTLITGCASTKTTNTARSGMEQLLIANAVDQALDKVDFTPFAGRKVFLDAQYVDCTDKNYVVSSVRHRMLRAGAYIQDKAETAEVAVEIRTGTVGTDQAESFIGTPEVSMPGGLLSIPEMRIVNRKNQTATAKIGLVAYDYANKSALGDGGMTLAKSDENQWFVLGVGPYRSGSVNKEIARGLILPPGVQPKPLPSKVAFQAPPPSVTPTAPDLQYASGQKAPSTPAEPGKLPATPAPVTTSPSGEDNPFANPHFFQ